MTGTAEIRQGAEDMDMNADFDIERMEELKGQLNDYYRTFTNVFPHYLRKWWTSVADCNERRDFINYSKRSNLISNSVCQGLLDLMDADGIAVSPDAYEIRREFFGIYSSYREPSLKMRTIQLEFNVDWAELRRQFFLEMQNEYRSLVMYATGGTA